MNLFYFILFFMIFYQNQSLGLSTTEMFSEKQDNFYKEFSKCVKEIKSFHKEITLANKAKKTKNLFDKDMYFDEVQLKFENNHSSVASLDVFNKNLLQYLETLLIFCLDEFDNNPQKNMMRIPHWLDERDIPERVISVQEFFDRYIYDFLNEYCDYDWAVNRVRNRKEKVSLIWGTSRIIFLVAQSLWNLQSLEEKDLREQINLNLMSIRKISKDSDFKEYYEELFKNANISIDSELIDLCEQERGRLFVSYHDYLKKNDEYYNGAQGYFYVKNEEESHSLSFTLEGIKIMTEYMREDYGINIKVAMSQEELKDILYFLSMESNDKDFPVGIIVTNGLLAPFSGHLTPIIVNKNKENKMIEIYSFDSARNKSNLYLLGLYYNQVLYDCSTSLQRDMYSCHTYSLFFIMTALKDIKENKINMNDLIKVDREDDIFDFPIRWSSVVQRSKYLKVEEEEDREESVESNKNVFQSMVEKIKKMVGKDKFTKRLKLNQEVCMIDHKGELITVPYSTFIQEQSEKENVFVIPIFFNTTKHDDDQKKNISTKETYYRAVLEKEGTLFCIHTLGKALKKRKLLEENRTKTAA